MKETFQTSGANPVLVISRKVAGVWWRYWET